MKKIKNVKPKVKKIKPKINEPTKSKIYIEKKQKLINTVLETFPEKITFTTKEKIARVDSRKLTLEHERADILHGKMIASEKKDMLERYDMWIKNYENLLNNLKKEKK